MAISRINHTQVSNDFIETHMKNLSGGATKVFLAISRKTIGWHKETDSISISQIMFITGLSNRGAINCIMELEKAGLINVTRSKSNKDYNYTNRYTIGYEESSQGYEESSQISSEESSQTKENIKETITKESKKFVIPSFEEVNKYIKDNNFTIDANSFLRWYNEANWLDMNGKKIKNWKLKLISWQSREDKNKSVNNKPDPLEKYYVTRSKPTIYPEL